MQLDVLHKGERFLHTDFEVVSSWLHRFAAESCLVWKWLLCELCFILLVWCTLRLKSLLWALWKLYLWQSWSIRYTSSHITFGHSSCHELELGDWFELRHIFSSLLLYVSLYVSSVIQFNAVVLLCILFIFNNLSVFLSENPKGWKKTTKNVCSLRHFILAETYFPP